MTKKKRTRIILIIAAIVVVIAAALVLIRVLNKNKKVDVFPVSMINDPYWGSDAQYTGNVSAGRVMNVKLRSALVESVPVHEGQYVSQGDVLLVYDAAEYQLSLLSDEANIAVQEARIEKAKKMARHYQSLRPSEDAPKPKKETIDHGPLPIKKELKAEDVKKEENEYMITPKTVITQEFLKRLREKGWMCRLLLYQDDTNFGTYIINGKEIPDWVYVYEADDETKPEAPTPPDEGEDTDPEIPEEPTEPEEETEPPTEPPTEDPDGKTYHKVKKDPIQKDWVLSDILSFDGTQGMMIAGGESGYYGKVTFHEPITYERYEEIISYPDYTGDPEDFAYSRAELAKLVTQSNREAAEAEKDLLLARIALQKDRLSAETGEVRSTISGVVTEVNDPHLAAEGDVVITVKGSENYVVTAYVAELDLDKIQIGAKETIYAYESGTSCTATITEIEKIPTTESWYGGNPNNSYYPVSAIVDDASAEMIVGEYCQVTMMQEEDVGETIFIPIMFVRNDEKGHYVMAAEDNRVRKRYVRTGKNMYGSEIEIRSGLSVDDYIAFPYGDGANDGAPAVRKEDTSSLYNW